MDELDREKIPEEDAPETTTEESEPQAELTGSPEEFPSPEVDFEAEPLDENSPALEDIIAEFHEDTPESDEETREELPQWQEPAPETPQEEETKKAAAPEAVEESTSYEEEYGETDYVPNPIIFQPPSRLRQLRKKLVVGPEHRYYELAELGLSKLAMAIAVTALFFILTSVATFVFYSSADPGKYARFLIFSQVIGIFVSALFGCNLIIEGGSDLLHGKFSANSMLLLTLIACGVDAYFCLDSMTLPFGAAFCLETTMALWASYHKRSTEIGQMDTMRKAVRLDALSANPDFYDGKPGVLAREGQVEEFTETYNEPSGPDKLLSRFTFLGFVLCLAAGIYAFSRYGAFFATRAFAAGMLCTCPATAFITLTRPQAILERRMHRLGAVICGWQGIKALSKKAVFPLDDADLFPLGTVKLNGVKVWRQSIEHAIGCAAALAELQNSGLLPIFRQLRESRNGRYYRVDEFRLYDNGGLGGIINEETVLMGPCEFMQQMGVEIPSGSIVENAVYLSADQKLCAVFALSYSESRGTAKALSTLCGYRWLTPLFIGTDCSVTPQLLRRKYRLKSTRLVYPPLSARPDLKCVCADPKIPASVLVTRDSLASRAFAVTGARCLGRSMRIGAGLHLAAGIIGLASIAAISVLGTAGLLSASNILLYQFIWVIPAILISEGPRIL